MDCYKQVTTMLDHLYDQRTASSYSPSVTVGSSVPASQDAAHLSQSEANDQVICCFFLFFLPLSVSTPPHSLFPESYQNTYEDVEVCSVGKYTGVE